MLEIMILFAMGKSIAAKARAKGRRGTPYVLLLLGLWFGGEIFGALVVIVATAVTSGGEPDMFLAYLGALGFAVLGAVIAFTIVGALQSVHDDQDDEWE